MKNFFYNNIRKQYSIITILICLYIFLYLYEKNEVNKLEREIKSLLPYHQKLLSNYLSSISSKYYNEKIQEKRKLVSLLSLINFTEISNNSLKFELRKQLLKELRKKNQKQNQNLSEIKIVYIEKSFRFGNSIVMLNNLLFYCEILNITNIYLNIEKHWPISENVTMDNLNITLISNKSVNFNYKNICIFDIKSIYFQRIIKPEIRIDKLKNEIKKNLPKILINPEDLFIHIRSGDIFKYKANNAMNYAQPPLCFYQSILNNFKFRNIYILTIDKSNPIIDLLIGQYKQIILTNNQLSVDLAILLNAYNIAASISSFLTSIIIINDNLKILWEYDNYRLTEKYLHLHHDIYNYSFNYSIYKMYPSQKYKNFMFPWINSKKQIDLMIKEKCNNFKLIQC